MHHFDTWNHEHQNAWNGNCACAQMILSGTNASMGVFGCHTSAYQDLRGAMCICEVSLDAVYEYVLHGHMMERRHGDVRDETQ